MRTECTLTDEELIGRSQEWVSKLAKSAGRDWSLQVPVNFNRDPDMLFMELCKRLTKVKEELAITDKLLQEREKLLDAIPECPLHGKCVPNALLWIEKQKKLAAIDTGL